MKTKGENMHISIPRGFTRVLVGAAILATGLIAGPFGAHEAGASWSSCSTDPIVYLSDGSVVTVTASINADPSDVKRVLYVLDAPAGTHVINVVYTGDAFAGKELFRFRADNPAGTYDSDTVAYTEGRSVPMTVTMTVAGATPTSGTVSGYSKHTLHVHTSGSATGQTGN